MHATAALKFSVQLSGVHRLRACHTGMCYDCAVTYVLLCAYDVSLSSHNGVLAPFPMPADFQPGLAWAE